MTINYAVDRLYQTGWLPSDCTDAGELERLPSGLRYPTVTAVIAEFASAGLTLTIKPHLMFGCCRAEWISISQLDGPTGTVVGSNETEAAVFALAKLREQQFEARATAGELTAVSSK